MSSAGWRIGRLREIPGRSEMPGFALEEYQQAMAERAPHILQRWADAGEQFAHEHRKTHDVRGFLGVESFGVNAFEARVGELLIVPHDELGEGEQQEELYLVVDGRARFVCDGEPVELGPGELLYARPGVRRQAIALETPTMLFIVGGRAGEAYSPPIWEASGATRTASSSSRVIGLRPQVRTPPGSVGRSGHCANLAEFGGPPFSLR